MTLMITPATFVCERDFEHSVALLYFAFTDHEARKVWYGGKERGFNVAHHTLDFREGGGESWRGQPHGDAWMTNDATFIDIVPDQRIIYSYVMTMDGALFTVSQQAVEFSVRGAGSHIRLTEQIMFIDRTDHLAGRIEGTQAMLDHLNAWLDAHIAGN
ncbi:MAG TPA: SRPBCC domain-containing protein [Asticcacaulis sp.]|nr:SRPBCC domain-containing protein [Asticcacaulis sp.]